ncbi:hypothetical protein [Ruegeria arenilitoris]|uniref:hypothetical protein n=1 Tax=Ruegeria arenilitoris TaxID=1173585 RepID=UPI00147E7D50|nr:hypothetical protein [Ruegeria arenilitoris]
MERTLKLTLAVLAASVTASPGMSAEELVLLKCGASSGKAYFFDGEGWVNDGISNGKIVLVGNAGGVEGKFDIRFDDSFSDIRRGYGYASDGASVFQVAAAQGRFSFIAAHDNYTDQYTFDTNRNEVLWTSHKVGTLVPKVALYFAECAP